MANEWTKVELTNSTGFPRRFTVADATAIDKGTLLKLDDPRTALACDTDNAPCAGIAAMDKEASDGSTSITVWTDGIFEAVSSGSITLGDPVKAHLDNKVVAADASDIGAEVLGYSLETGSAGETINVRLRL